MHALPEDILSLLGASMKAHRLSIGLEERIRTNRTWGCFIDRAVIAQAPWSEGDSEGRAVICEWRNKEEDDLPGELHVLELLVDRGESWAALSSVEYVPAISPQPSSSSSLSPSPSPTSSESSGIKQSNPLVAAIAGGVVGGLALICLLAFAIVCYCRKRRPKQVPRGTIDDDLQHHFPKLGTIPPRCPEAEGNPISVAHLGVAGSPLRLVDPRPLPSSRPQTPNISSHLASPSTFSRESISTYIPSGSSAYLETTELEASDPQRSQTGKGQVVTEWGSSGTRSRFVVHQDSGIRATSSPHTVGEEELVELPPAYTTQ
ncbi:hypothetical protein BKA70DRAFT_1442278 [Coprinopsis sp. MPI-PUGE-AT-0042]|nr:hypothetical protein BKA70DRAFT_1442278 [Coprinopsis sp. MPI-PUGE-AT-0042]